ncbi:phosphoglycolate phosphatase [Paenibacillus tianmuensis]|uniref:Phosphoglycolate phosphatase n=1 Tax=Paenibacillus tianmuensis TaxID=624147 RepID=A0A1G4TLK6_9BACL|nr:HAD family phosphatase [Paenibacillus tianmuensis]SCW82182.1 phosphoglycolate phosphatase [Paenibacillus tianmuensis]
MPVLTVNEQRYPIKAMLFDKDGTLLDFISLWGYWSESMYRHFASRVSGEIPPLKELWGTIHDASGHVSDYSRSGPLAMGSIGDLLAILAWQGYRLGLPWGEAMHLARESKQAADAELEQVRSAYPIDGMVSFVRQCYEQGLPMAVVTADETTEATKHLEWMGIRPFFRLIIGNDQVGRGKPYPDMVVKACKELGLSPTDVAVIGDTNGDMQMGNAAGAAVTIGLLGMDATQAKEHVLPDAKEIVSSYSQLQLEESMNES